MRPLAPLGIELKHEYINPLIKKVRVEITTRGVEIIAEGVEVTKGVCCYHYP